jgi:hypothetical protein
MSDINKGLDREGGAHNYGWGMTKGRAPELGHVRVGGRERDLAGIIRNLKRGGKVINGMHMGKHAHTW